MYNLLWNRGKLFYHMVFFFFFFCVCRHSYISNSFNGDDSGRDVSRGCGIEIVSAMHWLKVPCMEAKAQKLKQANKFLKILNNNKMM